MKKYAFATRRIALLASVTTMLWAAPSHAQASDAGNPMEDTTSGDEIVVTARKREESLLDVPIAVNAFNSASIQDKMAQDISDLADFTPGFQIQEAFGRDGDRPVMRGASNILSPTARSAFSSTAHPISGIFHRSTSRISSASR